MVSNMLQLKQILQDPLKIFNIPQLMYRMAVARAESHPPPREQPSTNMLAADAEGFQEVRAAKKKLLK
ncbi:hypothetical protein PR048_002143 [Dryococelus australis]|uniref:Uncharacterized protein n=1 Tax=Dryococelus australis TaxID=614101 RepID=A0ABQ9ILW8_9NEOP|nr:hypothetical protein PR048_002143 [Dryococelus australis]